MAAGLSVAVANAILDALFNQTNYTAPTALWLQLHTDSPGSAGTANVSTESTRKQVTTSFPAAALGSVSNDVAVTWTSVAGTETHRYVTLWTLSSGGSFIMSGTITAQSVVAGDDLTIPVGDIDATFSVAS